MRHIKVRADKLDHLIDLIGELVIAGLRARRWWQPPKDRPTFLEATQRVSELVQATRDGALALRMVPVGETFSRFNRVVRDTSKLLSKEIELVVTGGDTELDKSMVDLIGDPLMHLVRNSLDHGIETPEERLAAGKPRSGRLGLNAYHEAGSIVIEVSDDGRGLGRERIVKKALERGLIAEGTVLSDAEVWQLIFAPGFSTADAVTDISGRGVGMDVVKRNIESLRGQISLASTNGRGTTTQIRLPLTLAMIDGFLTLVGGVHYVLPLAVVSECIDLPRECRDQADRTSGTFDLARRSAAVPGPGAVYGAHNGCARRHRPHPRQQEQRPPQSGGGAPRLRAHRPGGGPPAGRTPNRHQAAGQHLQTAGSTGGFHDSGLWRRGAGARHAGPDGRRHASGSAATARTQSSTACCGTACLTHPLHTRES